MVKQPTRTMGHYIGWGVFWLIVFFPVSFYFFWQAWKIYQADRKAKELAAQQAAQQEAARAQARADAAARLAAAQQRMDEFRKRLRDRQDMLQVGSYKEYHYSSVELRVPLDWSDRFDKDYPPAQIGDDVEVVLEGDQVRAYTWDGVHLGDVVNTHADMARDFLPNGGAALARVSYITKYKVRLDLRMFKAVKS